MQPLTPVAGRIYRRNFQTYPQGRHADLPLGCTFRVTRVTDKIMMAVIQSEMRRGKTFEFDPAEFTAEYFEPVAQFCSECPLVPSGVTAELTAVRCHGQTTDVQTMSTASDNPQVDTNQGFTLTYGRPINEAELSQAIHTCTKPKKPNWLLRMLGAKSSCSCLPD